MNTQLQFNNEGFLHKYLETLNHDDKDMLFIKNKLHIDKNTTKPHQSNEPNEQQSFIIDLDEIWHWLGCNTKSKAKHILQKNFVIDIDYIKLGQRSDHNKEKIFITQHTLNLLSLRCNTDFSKRIQEYYLEMERIVILTMQDEQKSLIDKETVEGDFIHVIDELIPKLTNNKRCLVSHLIKNYKERIHYTVENHDVQGAIYKITQYTFILIQTSYKMRNNYLLNVATNNYDK